MRTASALVVLAATATATATACASHAPEPRFDPAIYAKLCQPAPDSETAKQRGCVLRDQGRWSTLPSDHVVQPPQQ